MAMSVGKKGVSPDMNVTPMIDILLVLLIIFMVMTPMMMMQHRVDVPKRSEVDLPPDVSSDQIVLTFTKDGDVYVNQTRVDRAELGKVLSEKYEKRRDKTLFLNFDPLANYGEVVRLIDLTRTSGAEKLAVVTQKPGEKFQVPGAPGSSGTPGQ